MNTKRGVFKSDTVVLPLWDIQALGASAASDSESETGVLVFLKNGRHLLVNMPESEAERLSADFFAYLTGAEDIAESR